MIGAFIVLLVILASTASGIYYIYKWIKDRRSQIKHPVIPLLLAIIATIIGLLILAIFVYMTISPPDNSTLFM